MSQAAYPRLWQMFGAFFHQDWDTEGDDWPDLVRNFARGQPQAELDATAAELDRLLADLPDDAALDRELFDVLGCSYLPRPDLGGPTVRVWLRQIAAFLRGGVQDAEPGAAPDPAGMSAFRDHSALVPAGQVSLVVRRRAVTHGMARSITHEGSEA